MSADASPHRIYHLALEDEWREAVGSSSGYRRSTLGKSLDEVGFIHCSFASQVETIADMVYRGRGDVVLLAIDTGRVQAEIRVENLEGGEARFPHIYGPLAIEAVVRHDHVALGLDGRLLVKTLLDSD